MWSRIVAWILAVVTALFHNMGYWQQEDAIYKGDPGYTVQKDVVDYGGLYSWYKDLYSDSNASCKVEAKSHETFTNVKGVGYIIAGQPMNPDAQLVFSDEDVIIAPGACKVSSEPSTSPDQIVVENNSTGADSFKMVINKPKRWFCCEDVTPTVTGGFYHKQDSHKIDLKQGDTICVASSDTTVTLYRGDGRNGGLQKCDLRTFLRSTDDELGDDTVNANGSAEQVKTNSQTQSDALCSAKIPAEKMYQGPTGWKLGKKWYYGKESGIAGKDYAAEQFIVYEGMYYYFDADGYMVTGWNGEYYYYNDETAYAEGRSDMKYGAMCYNTIVPSKEDPDKYVYVGFDGTVKSMSDKTVMADNKSYVYDEASEKYILSSVITSETGYENSTGDKNNGTVQNIGTQGERKILTQQQYVDLVENMQVLDSGMNGWYTYGESWIYLNSGHLASAEDKDYTSNDTSVYLITVGGRKYFFDDTTKLLVTNGFVTKNGSDDAYIVKDDNGALVSSWWQTNDGLWYYAGTDGLLYSGVHEDPGGDNKRYYAFNNDHTLDTETQIIERTISGAIYEFWLDGAVDGSRSRRLKSYQ